MSAIQKTHNSYMGLKIGDKVRLTYRGTSVNGGFVMHEDTIIDVREDAVAVYLYHDPKISKERIWISHGKGYEIEKIEETNG